MSVAGFEKGIKTIEVLQEAMGIYDYHKLHKEITSLVELGKLAPTKGGRDTNGRVPPLSKKYRIIPETHDDTNAYESEINRQFPLDFDRKYYKDHPKQYLSDRELILQMTDYYKRMDKPLEGIMSINERFLDIWGYEKISKSSVYKVLRNLGLSEEWLNIYMTPEPFIFYAEEGDRPKRILIVENKDTWHTVRRLIMEGACPFGCVIFGEGKKILKSIEEIPYHQKSWFRDGASSYEYFGDLDDEGIDIYLNLATKADFIELSLWFEGYEKMYLLGEAKHLWRHHKDQKNIQQLELSGLLGFMGNTAVQRICEQFEKNLYVPQEAVNYQVLREMWRN